MKIIHLLTLLASFIILINAHYSLYYSDNQQQSNSPFDCLYAYLPDYVEDQNAPFIINYHLIPYCRRLDQNKEQEKIINQSYQNVENCITFSELYRQHITSTQLLNWLVPIDIVERYEENGQNSNEVFYNCSLPWFGSTCQYRFEHDLLLSFSSTVKFIFEKRNPVASMSIDTSDPFSTCYRFIRNCYRGPSPTCLDWREVCDGKFDCMNGEDEELCELLEVNECSKDEFRCHFGGQCIPLSFVRDGKISTDCLDGTDEVSFKRKLIDPYDYECTSTPTFHCEELNSQRPLSSDCLYGKNFKFGNNCRINRFEQAFINTVTSLDHIVNTSCRIIFYYTIGLSLFAKYPLLNISSLNELLNSYCSSQWLVLPKDPVLFGLFQLVYSTNLSLANFDTNNIPAFICFNATRCSQLANCEKNIAFHNDLYCCKTTDLINSPKYGWPNFGEILQDLARRCTSRGTDETCSHPSLFHCSLSKKCISKHRLVDGFKDCYYGEDELFPTCQLNHSNRFICPSNPNKCLSIVAVGDGKKDCEDGEDEISMNEQNILKGKVPWGFFCDGENNLPLTNKSNETDETHCELWPCNTTYFRCDNAWHCLNGADELNCPENKCLLNEHSCVWQTDTIFDCIPISDLVEEYQRCNSTFAHRRIYIGGKALDNTTDYFLWNRTKCLTLDQLCSSNLSLPSTHEDTCFIQTNIRPAYQIIAMIINTRESVKCIISGPSYFRRKPKHFLITSRLNNSPSPFYFSSTQQTTHFNTTTPVIKHMPQTSWYCHRGIVIHFKTYNSTKCLCPPSYFGDRCQWQNQRISLTIQLISHTLTSTLSVFQVIIMIIDQQQMIYYHEQIIYTPKHDCSTKFNLYLLYPNQPKTFSSNYSIHIDIFDKIKLKYWASWHLSIPFQFLPVNRIATQLFIPTEPQTQSCSFSCGLHGRCVHYINKNLTYFCQCDNGYSGLRCNIKHNNSCSSDSFSLTSSICICPLNRFGSRCYLKHQFCQSTTNPCENNGTCVPIDDRIDVNQFRCLCREGFYGTRCEYSRNRIDIELNDDIIETTPAIYLHFITAIENKEHQHITTFKKILFDQTNVTLYVKQPFHILLVELFNESYYLTIVRERFNESESIQTKLMENQQCLFVNNLLNNTFKSYSYRHQIKYYPLLCRQNKQLNCFYDENYICICDLDRFSNCFTFDHNRTYNCQGDFSCQNGGKCFQDNKTCPSVSICVCSDCFYGTKCQLSTKGFVLSLDYILGYHIKPNLSFDRQPFIIKMSVGITTIMFVIGLINGILSILTFRREKTQESGCGFYLLVSSWISILLIIILMIKFWFLVLSQMMIFTNRTFLNINCILLDMVINVLLALTDWFGACISVERVITVNKGVNFNKSTSKIVAKWITLFITIFTFLTYLTDPLHRHLVDDVNEDEQRTWCLVQYSSSSVDIFNTFMTLFHFLIPFSMNLISSVIMVILISRVRSTIQPRLTFEEHLKVQMKKHKHHLISLCGLVLLALPRLIISFMSGCMKSPRKSELFLCGYLLSFLPSMLTLFVSILPSKIYKNEFMKIMNRTIRRFRSRL